MKYINFSWSETALVCHETIKKVGKQLTPEIERIKQAKKMGYDSVYASINLPFDESLRNQIKKLVAQKKVLKPTMLIVIGIGGSNLGTMAIAQAVYGKFYNDQQPDASLYFVDCVDTDYVYDIILLMEQQLAQGNTVLLNIISKSGTTTETIANAQLFIFLLKKHDPQTYHEKIIITTDEDSPLWQVVQKEQFFCLPIAKNVGGRFSVFSAAGLFPLAMIDIDIDALHEGARSIISACIDTDIVNNPAALRATLLFENYQNGFFIHDTFLFSVDLHSVGNWYRQLMAESVGKAQTVDGQTKNIGITPTVSIGSTDLHSVGQLYLGGPFDKFTSFISVEKNKSNVVIPQLDEYKKLVVNIQDKTLSSLQNAIEHGTKTAYKKNKRPFVAITIPEKSAFYLGQLLQSYMIEIMYLGFLLEVNPFDQPQVELYKQETRKFLANE